MKIYFEGLNVQNSKETNFKGDEGHLRGFKGLGAPNSHSQLIFPSVLLFLIFAYLQIAVKMDTPQHQFDNK